MSHHDTEDPPPRHLNESDDCMRSANEQLTLKVLQSEGQAEESAQRYTDQHEDNKLLVKKQRLLQSLVAELTLTEQRERKRLSTELHDYLAQMLALGRIRIRQGRPRFAAAVPSPLKLLDDLDDLFTKSLAYTRTLVAELSPLILHELGLTAALKSLGEQMETLGLHVAVDFFPADVALLEAQRALIYQSVRELLHNVLKHAKTGKATLSLRIRRDETLYIMVHDAGAGFDQDKHETHFTGEHFGLVSIRERMEAIGGWMHIQSALSQGTTVTLGLPLTQSLSMESAKVAATTNPASPLTRKTTASGTRRVLLVDDHIMVRQGLRMILQGYDDVNVVGEAGNGREAVSMATDLNPDFVVMDVNMPEMDGIEATRQIKAIQPATIVVGLSVNNSTQVQEAMTRAGAASFLSKEAAAEQLYATIAALAPLSIVL